MTADIYGKAIVRKLDNGYRGVIENNSERGLWSVGDPIFNRQLHPYPAGTLLTVTIKLSPKGRLMVKDIKVREAAEAKEVVSKKDSKPVTHTPAPALVDAPTSIDLSGYFINEDARSIFTVANNMSKAKPERAVKVMMVGPSGYGKTTLPKLFAQATGRRFLRMNCATIRDPEEWFGYREAREGSTLFIRSQFAREIEEGNLVVVLDEFNRLEPWLHNTLFPLLDDDGFTVVHDEKFVIGPNVVFVGTINSGYKYTGTFELDEALLNRFEFILEVGALPHREEVKVLTNRTGVSKEVSASIVTVSNTLRQMDVVCSTRTSLLIASMVAAGMSIREAFETAVVRRIHADVTGNTLRKQVIDVINTVLGPLSAQDRIAVDVFGGKQGSRSEEEQDAPDTSLRTDWNVTITVREPGKSFGAISVISLLRKIEFVNQYDEVEMLGVREAQVVVNDLTLGNALNFVVRASEAELSEFADALAVVGISFSY